MEERQYVLEWGEVDSLWELGVSKTRGQKVGGTVGFVLGALTGSLLSLWYWTKQSTCVGRPGMRPIPCWTGKGACIMLWRYPLLVVLVLAGCNGSSTTSPGVADVTLDVVVKTTSGSPTIRAEVRNGQGVAIRHGEGCSFWTHGMQLFFVDASGRKLVLADARAMPLCPDDIVVLQPGGRLEATTQLTGTLYTEAGELVVMQPGSYTAVVGFRWGPAEDPTGARHVLEKRMMFNWPAVLR